MPSPITADHTSQRPWVDEFGNILTIIFGHGSWTNPVRHRKNSTCSPRDEDIRKLLECCNVHRKIFFGGYGVELGDGLPPLLDVRFVMLRPWFNPVRNSHKPCELKKWWNNWNSFLDIGRRLHGECFWVSRLPESWCQPSKLDEKSQQPQILLMPQNGWIADKMFSATGTFYPRHHVNFRTWFCCGNVMPFRFFFTVWRAPAEFNIGHATDMTTVIDAKQSVDDGLQNGVDGFWTLRCLFLFCEIAEITGATRATKNWT